jgi:CxxC motif-containing protein (DUF1111 family)
VCGPQLLHDGAALTLRDAIKAHREQADASMLAFLVLTASEKKKVLKFLNPL